MKITKINNCRYVRVGDIWVRDFTAQNVKPVDLTNLYSDEDYHIVVRNEEQNRRYSNIAKEKITLPKIVIVSDGFDFLDRQKFLLQLPADVAILAVNGALRRWKLMSPKLPAEARRSINAYIINNPYAEAMRYMPPAENLYYPPCVASVRTNERFCKNYKGDLYSYYPSLGLHFGIDSEHSYYIDDYRNPVCAAIGLAFQFGVEQLMLVSCDSSFADKRDGSMKLQNGLYAYPQNVLSHHIIDANLFWLASQEGRSCKIADYSSGLEYINASYIKNEEEALSFFQEESR